jgi:hypothetical protein
MKDHALHLIEGQKNPINARNLLREYLQARILNAIQRSGGMIPLAFHGGTALRFLYGLPRHSEDLDFSLERPDVGYDPERLAWTIHQELAPEGYGISMKTNDRKTVHSIGVIFQGILFESSLSPYPDETLRISVEIDTRPPQGAVLETTLVRRHAILRIQHHDRSTLLAGKCNAFLNRPYTKGRDVYDLLWHLSDLSCPEPNLDWLNNALVQFEWKGPAVTNRNWRSVLQDKIKTLDFKNVVSDVLPFLENEEDAGLLTKENLMKVMGG